MDMENEEEILRRCSSRRPHAILVWEDAAKKIVAPATLVGMTWNHASSSSIPSNFGLLDNFIVPKELFELTDLDKVLTMEAWASCLNESEKKFLSGYLPDGVDRETAVRALLKGDNLHFGNPRHTWGVSVCSGAMHPDNLVKREKAMRKSCVSQKKHLRIYHSKMIDVLQKMKDIWRECEGNGKVLPRIYRWLKSTGRGSIPASANGLIPPKRMSEIDEKKAKSEHAKEKAKGHKTTRKDRSIEGQDSHSAKRLKTESGAADRFVDKEGEFPDSDFFKQYVKVSVGALSKEQLSDITLPVKVTREQFENVKLRSDAGEEVDFDSLQPDKDRGNVSDRDRKKKEVDKKDMEKLKRYWCEQVVRSLPGAHTRFLERKARLQELADSIARSCKEERAYLMPQYEEHCSPERVAQTTDEFRVPVDASDSGADEETLSRNSGGSDKHLLAGTASSEEIEEEFSTQSPREKETVDLDSAGEKEDVNSPVEQQEDLYSGEEDVNSSGEKHEQLSGAAEKPQTSESSVSRGKVEGSVQEVVVEEEEINFVPANTTWDRLDQADEPSVMPATTSPDNYSGQQRGYGDNSSGGFRTEQQPLPACSVLSSNHLSTFSDDATEQGNFHFPEKQELQLLPHSREPEIPEFHSLGAVPQSVQESAQLFADHPFESPIASLINFSKLQRQRMMNNQPPLPIPQQPYHSYSLPSSAPFPMTSTTPLPMAVPVVDPAPVWHRASPASGLAQFGGHVSDSSASRGGGSGWGLSEALQNATRRVQQQQVPLPTPPAAPVPPRWELPNPANYVTDQALRKPERMFDQQQFYSDWSSRGGELPAAASSHNESTPSYRPPSWYPTGPFDNVVGNALSGNQLQTHLPHQRHGLWPSESAPPKSVPQLWGNINWRPS